MTTSTRLSAGSLRLLPLFVPGFLLLLAVFLAPVSPAKATDGLYRVDTPEFAVVAGFDCGEAGLATTTCTVPVGGRPLTVRVGAEPHSGPCTATYDGRDVGCERVAQYGPASPWVRVGSLGVPVDEAPGVPWWRDALDLWWERVWLAVVPALALSAALAAFALYRGPRLEDPDRVRWTVITGVVCWLLPVVGGLLVVPWGRTDFAISALIMPHVVLLPAGVMALWQYRAAGPATGRLRGRFGQAVLAFVATLLLSGGALLWFAMTAGLPD